MTLSLIQNAGYVIANNEAIWGYGPTASDAWDSFRAEMAMGGVTILGSDDDSSDQDGSWTRESDYRCLPASVGLMAAVEGDGGNMSWDTANGVACTHDESEVREFSA